MKIIKLLFCILLIFIFVACSKSEQNNKRIENIAAFNSALDSMTRANAIINNGKPYSIIEAEDSEKILKFHKEALSHSQRVDYQLLNKEFAGFGDHFRDEFVRGIELFLSSHEKLDRVKAIEGGNLLKKWYLWYRENYSNIKK